MTTHADTSANGIETVSRCLFCGGGTAAQTIDGVGDIYFAADPGAFTFCRCDACRSLWLMNRPIGERLMRAYASYHTHAEPQPLSTRTGWRGALRRAYIAAHFARPSGALDRLTKRCVRAILPDNFGINRQLRFAPPAPARVLDYGCGSGEYLLWLEPLGHALVGAEYDPALLTSVARRGIEIVDVATADRQPWENGFDHITLAHVLEHVPDPRDLIARLFAWLKPGGTLFVELPNGDATGLALFGRYWRGLEAPRHFALPTRSALTAALAEAGFTIVRQDVDSTVRGWMWPLSLGKSSPQERSALEAAMQTAPVETADNAEYLIILARKPA